MNKIEDRDMPNKSKAPDSFADALEKSVNHVLSAHSADWWSQYILEAPSAERLTEELVMKGRWHMDCVNYQYEWEWGGLSCGQGKSQLETIGASEVRMGRCLMSLDDDLGSLARSKISECIRDIDATNASYDLPIMTRVVDEDDIDEHKKINTYNKSILRAALEADS